jgi:hypothetical protein
MGCKWFKSENDSEINLTNFDLKTKETSDNDTNTYAKKTKSVSTMKVKNLVFNKNNTTDYDKEILSTDTNTESKVFDFRNEISDQDKYKLNIILIIDMSKNMQKYLTKIKTILDQLFLDAQNYYKLYINKESIEFKDFLNIYFIKHDNEKYYAFEGFCNYFEIDSILKNEFNDDKLLKKKESDSPIQQYVHELFIRNKKLNWDDYAANFVFNFTKSKNEETIPDENVLLRMRELDIKYCLFNFSKHDYYSLEKVLSEYINIEICKLK